MDFRAGSNVPDLSLRDDDGIDCLNRFNRFLRVGHILFEGERREIDPHGVKARIRRLHCLRQ